MAVPTPIVAAPLFPELSRRFAALLGDLAPDDWERPVSAAWRVRDVVAHLLDGTLRRLSAQRDGFTPRAAKDDGEDYASLLAYLNRLNADWVRAASRLSPRVLIDLICWSDAQLAKLFASLDPHAPALWPVAWAGETKSENWFDIAREYTEKWHHAQQVFDAAVRRSTITTRELMHPCLDTLMRGLPHALRAHTAREGAAARVIIAGEAGGEWTVTRRADAWKLDEALTAGIIASVAIDQDEAWKVFMKRLNVNDARILFRTIRTGGDAALCNAVLEMVCVMA